MTTKTCLLAAMLLIAGLVARSDTAPKPDKVFWGKAVHDVQAGASLDGGRASFVEGERIVFKLRLRNVGKEPITFEAEGYAPPPFNWSAVTEERKHRVSIGRMLIINGITPTPISVTLAPGETQVLAGPSPTFLLTRMGDSMYTEPVVCIQSGTYSFQTALLLPRINGKANWVKELVTGALSLKVQVLPGSSTLP